MPSALARICDAGLLGALVLCASASASDAFRHSRAGHAAFALTPVPLARLATPRLRSQTAAASSQQLLPRRIHSAAALGRFPGIGQARGRPRTACPAIGPLSLVASAEDGGAEVWVEDVAEGEHGFKRVVMELELGGQTLRLETGEVGRLAAGAVLAKQGESVVYSTACGDLDLNKEEVIEDFVPMSVHYQERKSAAGMTKGGYLKRDGRPSDEEVLVSRIIDRTLRPMFPPGFCREVQILSWVLAYDKSANVDPLALVGSSAALLSSAIPFDIPVAGVVVGMDAAGNFVVNPTREFLKTSPINLFCSGTEDSVMMIEGAADFVSEDQMMGAIEAGMGAIRRICKGLRLFAEKALEVKGERSLRELCRQPNDSLYAEMEEAMGQMLYDACRTGATSKRDVYTAVFGLESTAKQIFIKDKLAAGEELPPGWEIDVKNTFKKLTAEVMRKQAKDTDKRVDGRATREVRPISVSMRPLPTTAVHGSALFTRGETQALATVTLGDAGSRQTSETLDGEEKKRFYLQYNFPPSCVGECGRVGAIGRREIGHGNLAERGLLPVIPSETEFPYTIRLESLITESCGSSSMGSVCGGCLALYDAGVPLKKAVAGVAMGLLMPENLKRGNEDDKDSIMAKMEEEAVILTDILGLEDALGTMDFKVCGDAKGISAFQLDIKCEGLSPALLRRALEQAREGRLHMLFHMLKAQPQPATELSPSVSKMVTLTVPQTAIGKIIGPGGANIRALIEEFALTNIDIQEKDGAGIVTISSNSAESNAQCEDKVRFMVQEAANFSPSAGGTKTGRRPGIPDPEVGKVYDDCLIVGVHPFGCFVELFPGKEGLVHVSELDERRIANVEDEFVVGDRMPVKVLALKDRAGKLRLSRKAALQDLAGSAAASDGIADVSA